jgi:hypothetical protein
MSFLLTSTADCNKVATGMEVCREPGTDAALFMKISE